MNNNEQIFYVTYREDDGYLNGMINQDSYNKLSDDDKQKYTQVIVDLKHLNGWGRYWDHVRYVNGALNYPDNFPKDQSETIADLKASLSKIIASNNDKAKSNQDLQAKLKEANRKIADANSQIQKLGKLSGQLQLQIANVGKPTSNAAKPTDQSTSTKPTSEGVNR